MLYIVVALEALQNLIFFFFNSVIMFHDCYNNQQNQDFDSTRAIMGKKKRKLKQALTLYQYSCRHAVVRALYTVSVKLCFLNFHMVPRLNRKHKICYGLIILLNCKAKKVNQPIINVIEVKFWDYNIIMGRNYVQAQAEK